MKYLLAAATLIISGCSAGLNQQPQPHKVMDAEGVTTPYVEFMGDDQAQGIVAYANQQDNSIWKCSTCVAGQTSTAVLQEVPAVIALKPDVVFLLTGAYDLLADPMWPEEDTTSENIASAVTALNAQGIPVVIGNLPPSESYYNYYVNLELSIQFQEPAYHAWVTGSGDGLADLADIIADQESLSDIAEVSDGVDLNQNGIMLTYPIAYAAVEGFHVGGVK